MLARKLRRAAASAGAVEKFLAVVHDTSPFVTIYGQDADTFTKLSNPATLPQGSGDGVAFSADGTYMAVTTSPEPFITIYKRSGDTFTKLADPAILPTGRSNGVAFYPRAFEGPI